MQTLTDAELDAVSGGQTANANLTFALVAEGATSATTSGTDVALVTLTRGGLSPSALSAIAATLTSASSSAAEG